MAVKCEEKLNILTTGIHSGIGRFIYEKLGGIGITRETANEVLAKVKKEGVDIIIHCAFNSEKNIDSENLYNYYLDNVVLTNSLTQIPHKKFIYFSTVDVYPKNNNYHNEDEVIKLEEVVGIYAYTKLISECIAKNKCQNYMIVRPTTLVGKYSRKNTLLKIIEGDDTPLFLSEKSVFNYVLHSDILEFIKFAIKEDICGIYNVACSENISLLEVADILGRSVKFGDHVYNVGNISNRKIYRVFNGFGKSSKDVLVQFLQELRGE